MTRRSASRVHSAAAGFTIVELLIATVVFSMVLIVITVGVLSFTRSYYRGINQSNTQAATRSILETISQAIQFSGDKVTSPVPAGPNGSVGFCIGNQHYSYVLRKQLADDSVLAANQSHHVLVINKNATSCGGFTAQNMSGSPTGTELLRPGMRLAKLSVTQVTGTDMWRVNIRVVFGDDDLVCSPAAGDCAVGTVSGNLNATDLACKVSISGSQYCAQSELTTLVRQRIAQ